MSRRRSRDWSVRAGGDLRQDSELSGFQCGERDLDSDVEVGKGAGELCEAVPDVDDLCLDSQLES